MPKAGHYIHRVVPTITSPPTFTTSYASDQYIQINLNTDCVDSGTSIIKRRPQYEGFLQIIRISGNIGSGATKITIKGYQDVDGQRLILPPTEACLEADISGGQSSVCYLVNACFSNDDAGLFIFAKTDTGTFEATDVEISWYE